VFQTLHHKKNSQYQNHWPVTEPIPTEPRDPPPQHLKDISTPGVGVTTKGAPHILCLPLNTSLDEQRVSHSCKTYRESRSLRLWKQVSIVPKPTYHSFRSHREISLPSPTGRKLLMGEDLGGETFLASISQRFSRLHANRWLHNIIHTYHPSYRESQIGRSQSKLAWAWRRPHLKITKTKVWHVAQVADQVCYQTSARPWNDKKKL
jgi:hypothetical protein